MLKPFVQWLIVTLASFGALAGGYHAYLTLHPERILVVVDTSFPMRASRVGLEKLLLEIDALNYKEFLLYTDKSAVHGWRSGLQGPTFTFYGPRDWEALKKMRSRKEFSEAERIILITNAAEQDLTGFSGWSIVNPDRQDRSF